MTAWRYGKALLFAIAVISVTLKAFGSARAVSERPERIVGQLAEFLDGQGFSVEPPTSDVDLFSLMATNGECQALVAVLSPQGWHRDVIRGLTPAGDRLHIFYDGENYQDQPVFRTRMANYVDVMLRATGLPVRPKPVIGVIASAPCNLDTAQWNEMSASFHT